MTTQTSATAEIEKCSVFLKFLTPDPKVKRRILPESTLHPVPPLTGTSTVGAQACQIYFFKKGHTFSKKRPKLANKIAEKGQTLN